MRNLMNGVCTFSTAPEQIVEGVYRLCIPFDGNIFTTSFVFTADESMAIYDTGNSEMDAEQYILPFLEQLGREPAYILLSHLHGDHCGGTEAVLHRYPQAKVISFAKNTPYPKKCTILAKDGEILFERYRLLHLPGHSADSMGIFDEKTRTLFSGDCLQQYGITRFPAFVDDIAAYEKTRNRVREMEANVIIASHHYVPCGHRADGKREIEKMLDACVL